MPQRAYMNDKSGNIISANEVKAKDRKAIFLCCTDNCDARLVLCKAGEDGAYFRSKKKKDHISAECVKNLIVFKPDTFDEDLFNLNFAFESMLGENHTIQTIQRGSTGTRQGNVGNHRRIRIHTLPTLYAMCISRAKNATYNGFLIDDILADKENYGRYSSGILGYKIVEATCYFYTDDEMSITLNYPLDYKKEHKFVKIIFDNKDLYEKQKAKLFPCLHIELVVIAGEWKNAPNGSKHFSECKIHKDTQIYYAKM